MSGLRPRTPRGDAPSPILQEEDEEQLVDVIDLFTKEEVKG